MEQVGEHEPRQPRPRSSGATITPAIPQPGTSRPPNQCDWMRSVALAIIRPDSSNTAQSSRPGRSSRHQGGTSRSAPKAIRIISHAAGRSSGRIRRTSGAIRISSRVVEPADLRDLGARLREGREAAGLSVRELARRIGVSASLLSQVERGLAHPSVGTLWAVVTALGLSLDSLFAPADEDRPAIVQRAAEPPALELEGGVVLGAADRRARPATPTSRS